MFRKTASLVVPALVGAIAAIFLTTRLSTPSAGSAHGKSATADARRTAAARSGDDVTSMMTRANSQRLLDLEQQIESSGLGDGAGSPPPDEEMNQDPEQRRAQVEQEWTEQIDAHDAEPVDSAWSKEVTPLFEKDLAELGEGVFETVDVQCHTTTCSAVVEFSSFDDAKAGFSPLLHHIYEVNCGTKTVLSDPEDPNAPYAVTMLYDCAYSRQPGALARR